MSRIPPTIRLCSLENLDEQGQLKEQGGNVHERTIRPERTIIRVDTPSEALAVSIGEHGKVDLPYMAQLLGTPRRIGHITTDLSGVIFKDPAADPTDPEAGWQMADEYAVRRCPGKAANGAVRRRNEPGVCGQCGCADQGAAQRTGSLRN